MCASSVPVCEHHQCGRILNMIREIESSFLKIENPIQNTNIQFLLIHYMIFLQKSFQFSILLSENMTFGKYLYTKLLLSFFPAGK